MKKKSVLLATVFSCICALSPVSVFAEEAPAASCPHCKQCDNAKNCQCQDCKQEQCKCSGNK